MYCEGQRSALGNSEDCVMGDYENQGAGFFLGVKGQSLCRRSQGLTMLRLRLWGRSDLSWKPRCSPLHLCSLGMEPRMDLMTVLHPRVIMRIKEENARRVACLAYNEGTLIMVSSKPIPLWSKNCLTAEPFGEVAETSGSEHTASPPGFKSQCSPLVHLLMRLLSISTSQCHLL